MQKVEWVKLEEQSRLTYWFPNDVMTGEVGTIICSRAIFKVSDLLGSSSYIYFTDLIFRSMSFVRCQQSSFFLGWR